MSTAQALLALLPQHSACAARLHDAAARTMLQLPAWRERLALGASPPASPQATVLEVHTRLGRLQLRIDHGFDALVQCRRLADTTQRHAVAGLLITQWAGTWLPMLGACTARFVDAASGGDEAGLPALQSELGGATLLQADTALFAAVHAALDATATPRTTLLARCGALRLAGRLLLARQPTAQAALRRLRAGDVVLTRRRCAGGLPRLAGGGALEWTWPDTSHALRARCTAEESTMTLDTAFDLQHDPHAPHDPYDSPEPHALDARPDPEPEPHGHASPPTRLDALELPLSISLPAPLLTLAELAALAPGAVLTLPGALEDAIVRLSVEGQTLAHGELVAIGGRLGVRIVRLAGALAAPDRSATP